MHGAAGSAWRAASGHCSGCDRVVVPVRPPFSLSPARLALWVGEVEHLSRDKGITRPSATPWGCWWRAAGVALLLWSVMACSPGGLWDPDGIYWSRYDGWGKQLQQHRDANFAWKDGSVWLDGVSHVPPKLPLESGASVGESLTCAQEETLIMLAFPTDREPEKWHLLPDAEEVNRQWRTEFALMVWGSHADAQAWSNREPFAERCGLASHYRLFNPSIS